MARRRIVGDFLRELVDDGDGTDERLLAEIAGRLDRRDAEAPALAEAEQGGEPTDVVDEVEAAPEGLPQPEAQEPAPPADVVEDAPPPGPSADTAPAPTPLDPAPARRPAPPVAPEPARDIFRGVDGVFRDADGNEIQQQGGFVTRQGVTRDAEGGPVDIHRPIGVVGGVRFDERGNVVDEDGVILVPVDEVQFDAEGNVVDADGEIVVAFDDTEGRAAEEERLSVLARGVDGVLRDADGTVRDDVRDTEDGFVDDDDNVFTVLDPVGDIGALRFDAFGNLVDADNELIAPVDELQFDAEGNVVDENGTVLAAQQALAADPVDEDAEDARLAQIRAENRAAAPVTLVRGVDGKLRTLDGQVSRSIALTNVGGELIDFEGHRVAEVLGPVGLVGGVLFDDEGNVVDADGTILVPVEDVQFDADGNVVDADGEIVVPFADTETQAEDEAAEEAERNRPVALSKGSDGVLRRADGVVVDRDSLTSEEGDVTRDDEGHPVEVVDAIGTVGAFEFDAFGNLVDDAGILASAAELFFDEQGNAVDADGALLADQQRFADDDVEPDPIADDDRFGAGSAPPASAAPPTDVPPPRPSPDDVRVAIEEAASSALDSAAAFLGGIFGSSDDDLALADASEPDADATFDAED